MSTGANLLAVSLTPSPRVRSSDDWAKRGTMGQCTCTEVAGPQNLKQTEDRGCDTSVQICRSQISFRERRGNRQKRPTTFLERARKGRRQSDGHGALSKVPPGTLSAKRDRRGLS